MSPATEDPAPTSPDDDFLVRLRRSAEDAVPPSTLDLDVVLRSSRRGVQRRRSLAGVAGVVTLGLVGTGVVTAGGPGGLRDLAREVVAGSPGHEVVTARATVVDVAPGVLATAQPAAYVRDDGTFVLDLGLPAWDGKERFLVEAGIVNDLGHVTVDVTLRAGDDDDLAALRAGRPAGTVIDDGPRSVVVDPASGRVLVVGVTPNATIAGRDASRTFVALAGEAAAPAGAVTSFELPTAQVHDGPITDYEVYAALLDGDGTALPDVRGVMSFAADAQTYHSCTAPRADEPDRHACAVRYDAATGHVEADREYPRTAADPVLDALRAEAAAAEESRDVPDLLRPCLAARGLTEPLPADVRVTDSGPVADTWRRCLVDATEAQALARS